MISTVNQITNFPITCERGNSNQIRLPQRVADSCHVLQSLIFMMLGHMGKTHTDGLPVQLINQICSIYISAHECYNFVFKGLIDRVKRT